MAKLAEKQIATDAATLHEMLSCGMFHSAQDGRWRYTPYANQCEATFYVNDPTDQFPLSETFRDGCAAKAWPEHGLFVRVHRDGTRGLDKWDAPLHQKIDLLYSSAMRVGEIDQRAWIAAAMGV